MIHDKESNERAILATYKSALSQLVLMLVSYVLSELYVVC